VRRRLLASYLTLAAIVLLALEIPLGISFARNERRDLTTKVERDAVALASLSEDALEAGTSVATVEQTAASYTEETGGRVVIVNAAAEAVADTSEPGAEPRSFASRPEFIQALTDGRVATGVRHSATLGGDILFVAVPVASGGSIHGAVRITYPTSEVDARVRRSWAILAAIGVTVLGVSALVGWRFARATAEPLARLERAAGAAGAGDLTARAPIEGPPEVRSLASRFNQMVERISDLLRSQEAFVADASHQLRTPLAALRLRLENLDQHVDAPGQDNLEGAIAELDRLSRLLTGLLVLAGTDAGAANREPIDLAKLVHERVELWAPLVEEQSVRVVAVADGPTVAEVTPGRVEQVLDNLIENALVVSPPGGTITVALGEAAAGHELHVTDEGPGLSAEERARAFDRFWRSERATTQGTGLGLAIVQRLVESDGGSIELRTARGGGLDAVVTLPAS
jgi:signal transduction histidine kinase